MKRTMSVAGACLLGGFIGTLTAIDIAARFSFGSYFWGIGALLGGLVAYVAIDFRQFCSGVARAYRETLAWMTNPPYWKAVAMAFAAYLSMLTTMLSMFILVFVLIGAVVKDTVAFWQDVGTFMFFVCGVFSGFLSAAENRYVPRLSPRGNKRMWLRSRKASYRMLVSGNVVMVIWYTLYYGSRVLYWVIMNSPRGAKKVCKGIVAFIVGSARFVGKAFVFVHSSRRTLCLVDAALGAAVGYHYANPIIGAFVGALLGAINYELVSVRLLKIAPQTAR